MALLRLAAVFAVLCAGMIAQSMQAQEFNSGPPPAWENCGESDDHDNHNTDPGDGPQLGSGTGSSGDYVTWTYDPPGADPAVQFRILRSAVTEQQWTTLSGLVGRKIEFTMEDGKVTDIAGDV